MWHHVRMGDADINIGVGDPDLDSQMAEVLSKSPMGAEIAITKEIKVVMFPKTLQKRSRTSWAEI